MAYLYNKGSVGANAYVIQHRANILSQEHNYFRGALEESCLLSCLEKYEEETSGEKARINYRITRDGITAVEQYRNPQLQSIMGSIEDLLIGIYSV